MNRENSKPNTLMLLFVMSFAIALIGGLLDAPIIDEAIPKKDGAANHISYQGKAHQSFNGASKSGVYVDPCGGCG